MAGGTVDQAATRFSIGLYDGIGEGESVAAAFKQGCAAIGMTGAGDPGQPQLRVRQGVDVRQRSKNARVSLPLTKPIGLLPTPSILVTRATGLPFFATIYQLQKTEAPAWPSEGLMPPSVVAITTHA